MKRYGFIAVIFMILLTFGLTGCLGDETSDTNVVGKQIRQKQQNIQNIFERQPTPMIKWSMDRYLQKERLLRFNDPNKMNYLYICFPGGEWIQFTIIGKLASTSKRLTPPVKQYRINNGSYEGTALGPAPDEMAVFGNSSPAKIGMTTLGSLFEMGGFISYIYSETPLNFKNMLKEMIEIEVSVTPAEKAALETKLKSVKSEARN